MHGAPHQWTMSPFFTVFFKGQLPLLQVLPKVADRLITGAFKSTLTHSQITCCQYLTYPSLPPASPGNMQKVLFYHQTCSFKVEVEGGDKRLWYLKNWFLLPCLVQKIVFDKVQLVITQLSKDLIGHFACTITIENRERTYFSLFFRVRIVNFLSQYDIEPFFGGMSGGLDNIQKTIRHS